MFVKLDNLEYLKEKQICSIISKLQRESPVDEILNFLQKDKKNLQKETFNFDLIVATDFPQKTIRSEIENLNKHFMVIEAPQVDLDEILHVFLFKDQIQEHRLLAKACLNFMRALDESFTRLKGSILNKKFLQRIVDDFRRFDDRNVSTAKAAFVI